MTIANELMEAFFRQYPAAREGKMSLPEMNRLLSTFQQQYNERPIDDFDGISPTQMHYLMNRPLDSGCMLQLNKNIENTVEKVPLFQLAELLIAEIRKSGKLKLTVTGSIPVKICELLYNQNLIDWKYRSKISRMREFDIPYIECLKHFVIDSGIVKKVHNSLSLTKNGEKFIAESKAIRFKQLLHFVTEGFNWQNLYHIPDNGEAGQLAWAFSLLLLLKYGGKPKESEFYSGILLNAFERAMVSSGSYAQMERFVDRFNAAYQFRFFECFANWFGLINIERKRNPEASFREIVMIRKTALMDELFHRV